VGQAAFLIVDSEYDHEEYAEREAAEEHGGDDGQDENHVDHSLVTPVSSPVEIRLRAGCVALRERECDPGLGRDHYTTGRVRDVLHRVGDVLRRPAKPVGYMPNERLRAALLQQGMTVAALAETIGVDNKTVERWITQDRVPYRKHRYAVASRLGFDETYLWPDALTQDQVTAASGSELVTIYPHRWAVPRDAWGRLFATAKREIGILVYVGLFLAEDNGVRRLFREKAEAGVRVRILLGDPDSPQVAQRGEDEGIDDAVASKVRNALVLYEPLRAVEGVEFRLHRTVLYNSIYQADEQLLINTHVYGINAAEAPLWHLRKVAGGDLFNTYTESFERVWAGATQLPGD
jgi:transcriptional regulator with XRE-family HTH domain